ncbi:MAG: DUF5320 domain-containing protein [Candidatus Peregrinibacteria bacterium]
MPNADGTGPMGQGPMTGRGWGKCGTARGAGKNLCPLGQRRKKEVEKKLKELE